MAPEQVRGEAADPRTDIWALGVLLYEMTAGARPFERPSVPEIFSAVLRDRRAKSRVSRRHPAYRRPLPRKGTGRAVPAAQDVRAALETLQTPRPSRAGDPGQRRRVSPVVAVGAALAGILTMASVSMRARFAIAWPAVRAGRPRSPLPLVNGTSDPDQQLFIDGLTEHCSHD